MAKAGETQDRCTQYALDVVSGKITAGEYVRLACQRHLDDIEKSKAAPYKYYFDVEKSEEIINFAEELTIAEGEENEHVTAYPLGTNEKYNALQIGLENTIMFETRACDKMEEIRLNLKEFYAVYKGVEFKIYDACPMFTDDRKYQLKCRAGA